MVLPYVYKLTHKVTGQFYIGYRSANKNIAEEDIGVNYFSSSKKVKELGFENFNIEILAEFFTKNHAYDFEQEAISESFGDSLCLNQSCYYGYSRFDNTGNKHSDETKLKISLAHVGANNCNYGKIFSQEHKNKLSLSKSGESNPMYGRKGKESKRSKPVIVNGNAYDSITLAAISNDYLQNNLTNILNGRRNLNKKIWQACYI